MLRKIEIEQTNNNPTVWLYFPDGVREPAWSFFDRYKGGWVDITIRKINEEEV